MIGINHNLAAAKTASNLAGHYGNLATYTVRLSSGLRINGAADDAAGLAIRELMRADIAAINQGVRNANDAISMLQTFDGALGIIDEKLIRMKELAEQAATGTYDSTQRLMIDSEFQAMGEEINRIANATDFNGVKLLCPPVKTWFEDEEQFVITNPGSVEGLTFTPSTTTPPHINAAGVRASTINADNLIDEGNPVKTISISLTAGQETRTEKGRLEPHATNIPGGTRKEYKLGDTEFSVAYVDAIGAASNPVIEYDQANGWSIKDDNYTGANGIPAYTMLTINPGATTITGVANGQPAGLSTIEFSMDDVNSGTLDLSGLKDSHPNVSGIKIDSAAGTYSVTRSIVQINAPQGAEYAASYNENNHTVTVTLNNGSGSVTLQLDDVLFAGDKIDFDINIAGETKTVPVEHHAPDPDQKVKIHFGPGNDSAEDYYYINYEDGTLLGLGLEGVDIQTQDNAQAALGTINDAIIRKDQIRAKYGTLQNRLENTVANLGIQSENLQAAESRISDADVASEMTRFVRNQILTQSAVAMLAQANSMPQMAMTLIR